MSVKDMLVFVDDGNRDEAPLQAAVDVALANDARLNGIYVVNDPFSRVGVTIEIPTEVREAMATSVREDEKWAEKHFRDNIGTSGLETEWHSETGDMIDVVTRYARYTDLVVAGQSDPESYPYSGQEVLNRLVLAVGCPVLIIPRTGRFEGIGSRIMIAWDASRSAARAVRDAMPFLEQADDVKVVSVNSVAEGTKGPATCLCRRLERLGIKTEAQDLVVNGRKCDILLDAADKEGANLIVMGAYGHSRWHELILGGVTQHMLSHATIPVLMSH
jgi:nucleotide-binding universal stress UspA family protein